MNPSRIVRYAFTALSVLLPVFFLPLSWVSAVQSKLLLVSLVALVAIVAYSYERIQEGNLLIPRSLIAVAGLLLPIVYALSALFAGVHATSFVSGTGEQDTVAIVMLFYTLLLVGALAMRSALDATIIFLRSVMTGSLALMVVQVFHVFVPSVTLGLLAAPATSVFGSWHEVGIMAGLAIFLSVALWPTKVLVASWRYVAIALSVLSVVMLFVVNMRDVWVLLALFMILFAVYRYTLGRKSRSEMIQFLLPALIGVIAGGAAIAGSVIYESLPTRMQVLQIEVRPSWQGTFAISRESVAGPRTALLGTGPNTFSKQWSLYKPAGVNQTEFWNADFTSGIGFIPTTFITVGLLGILAWFALIASLIWAFCRFLRKAAGNSDAQILVALFATGLYLAAFHIVYVPTASLSLLMFLAFGVIAAWAGTGTRPLSFDPADWRGLMRSVLVAILVVFSIVATIWTLRAVVSEMLVNKSAIVYTRETNAQKALRLVQMALLIYNNNDRAHRAAVELGLIRLGELVAGGGTTDQSTATLQVSLENTIQHGLAAVSINGGDYQNWLALAGLYRELAGAGVQGAYENARAAYAEVYNENPLNPLPLVQMAQLDVAQNKTADALATLDKALSLKPDFAAAYYLRSQVHATGGNRGQAVLDARKVVEVAPEDALGWYNLGAILYDSQSFADAIAALERATALQNDYANALYILGLSYDKAGRKAEAIAALEKVAQLNPSDTGVQQVLQGMRAAQVTGEESEEE